jgi:hypothetical protein
MPNHWGKLRGKLIETLTLLVLPSAVTKQFPSHEVMTEKFGGKPYYSIQE